MTTHKPICKTHGKLILGHLLLAGGEVPSTQWSRDAGGEMHILHVHGPKLDKVNCVLDFMGKQRSEKATWTEERKGSALQHCGIEHHQAQAMISILEAANRADGGGLYRKTQVMYTKLLRQAESLLMGDRKTLQS